MLIEIRDLKITFLPCFLFGSLNRQSVTWPGPAVMKYLLGSQVVKKLLHLIIFWSSESKTTVFGGYAV